MDNPHHRRIVGATDEMWKTYRKFAFVRCPYDKLVSAYTFVKTKKHGHARPCDVAATASFGLFLRSIDSVSNFAFGHAFISQHDHLKKSSEPEAKPICKLFVAVDEKQLLGYDGAVAVDNIARFSDIDGELCRIMRENGSANSEAHLRPIDDLIKTSIRAINASPREFDSLADYYDQFAIDFVNSRFSDDFAHFGFRKYASVAEMREAHK